MKSARPVAIVTGASHGIGAGLVEGYRARGYGVVATARAMPPSKDEQVLAIAGDIRERATARDLVLAARERFGRLDTLVNNAGLFIGKPFLEYTQEDLDSVTGTNLTGLFHVTQVVLAELLSQGSGHIVNISASVVDQPLASAPSGLAALTKGGVSALTKSLAIEFARRGCASTPSRRASPGRRCTIPRPTRARPAGARRTPGRGARRRRGGPLPRVGRLRDRGDPSRRRRHGGGHRVRRARLLRGPTQHRSCCAQHPLLRGGVAITG